MSRSSSRPLCCCVVLIFILVLIRITIIVVNIIIIAVSVFLLFLLRSVIRLICKITEALFIPIANHSATVRMLASEFIKHAYSCIYVLRMQFVCKKVGKSVHEMMCHLSFFIIWDLSYQSNWTSTAILSCSHCFLIIKVYFQIKPGPMLRIINTSCMPAHENILDYSCWHLFLQ